MNKIPNLPATIEEDICQKKGREYPYRIYWSDEDECFIGYAHMAGGNCCHGDTPAEVRRQLEVIIELCLEIDDQERETSAVVRYA